MHNMLPFRRFCLSLALMSASLSTTNALTQSYCSSENTGADYSAITDIYQSNGACQTTCAANYAFAVVQYQKCWCSNYIPSSQVSVGGCNQDCPGFPSEKCGNTDEGLFGYIALNKQPLGVAGASSSLQSSTSSSSTEEQETSLVSRTVVQTVTQTAIQPPATSTSSSSSSSSTPSSTSQNTRTQTPTPVTNIIMTTISGAVVTQTVTSTPVIAPGANDNISVQRSDGLSGGAIAGTVVGVLAGVALVAALIFLLCRRKRNNTATETSGTAAGSSHGSKKNMTRNVSVLSKAGLLSRGATHSMTERDDEAYTATTGGNSVRHSMLFGPSGEGVSPVSPLGSSHGEASSGGRRPSKPMVYDQRLNPSALFINPESNGSRVSMQDTQDYSRPILGVTNPDPRPSFESRM